MTADTREPLRLIQRRLDKQGHPPGPIDGLWDQRTARAMKALLSADGHAAWLTPSAPLPWMTEARSALGRHEARDCSWLIDWPKRDGRSLGDLSKTPWRGDFVETWIRLALPSEPLLGALGSNPYWARNWMLFGQQVPPIVGAVLVVERGSGGHVGFALGQDDTHFYVLGGNQSDAVTLARIAQSRLLGAGWSATVPPRLQRLQTMTPGDVLTSTNEA